ncbi:MAG: M3 family oligoendopeptidase [Firmicutes bacterium]|nr:M3 family oligoendopeptidase [Bacillota bacterium]
MSKYSQNWDLESVYPGGSSSEELLEQVRKVKVGIETLHAYIKALSPDLKAEQLITLVNKIQAVMANLGQPSAFVGCLTAQDVQDQQARLLEGNLSQIKARLSVVLTEVDQLLVAVSPERWVRLLEDPHLRDLSFPLREWRLTAQTKMPAPKEALAADLAVDGYHAWSRLYNTVVGRMKVKIERRGKIRELSVGQAANLLSEPDRNLRRLAFHKLEQAWAQEGELCASALNHIAGFRLNLYRNRGWDDVLSEPLRLNRMQRETLDAMWSAVEGSLDHLKKYLKRKAQLLGLEKLSWYDLEAPLGEAAKGISYDQAADFILEQLGRFSPEIANFTKNALEKNWIEAEDRAGKRPGAFCTSFPLSKESRVFMTYAGTIQSLGTLAHELGHAYHGYVLKDAPFLLRRYAMNVAETASTFSELLVVDGALQEASPQEKVGILEDKIQRDVAFFMNIKARFLFETRFYRARREGLIGVEQLNDLMLRAQEDAYGRALAEYHPHFWASKLHFYLSSVPFYNFPYTFGYLFSSGVYARAKAEGPGFASSYRRLLADTAKMNVEDLARKHLGADLTQPEFWEAAVQLSRDDVDQFLAIT